MQIFSTQKSTFSNVRVSNKAQPQPQPQAQTETEKPCAAKPSRVSAVTTSLAARIRGCSLVKKTLGRKKKTSSITPSLASSSSTLSYESFVSGPYLSKPSSLSRTGSSKSMELEALIFDHPTVTVRICPTSHRTF
ncbi:hypothetical protein J3Q64DRAFT_1700315 [Phycomyces blakesleeanus]|uniref:Uncharacterized protein n=1 Tax=Phycomyces blakesleeanus TaxID=4837 RepID=A0ABR3AYV8_PHYBL